MGELRFLKTNEALIAVHHITHVVKTGLGATLFFVNGERLVTDSSVDVLTEEIRRATNLRREPPASKEGEIQ